MAGPWVIHMTQGPPHGSPRHGSLPYLFQFATNRPSGNCLQNSFFRYGSACPGPAPRSRATPKRRQRDREPGPHHPGHSQPAHSNQATSSSRIPNDQLWKVSPPTRSRTDPSATGRC